MHRLEKAHALAVLIVLGLWLLLPLDMATSQAVDAYYPTDYHLIGATSSISGTLADLQSDNNVYMVFGSYLTRTTAKDSPNLISDVDQSPDKGTHSNFVAQQSGPDLINDTLTETRHYGGVQTVTATGSVPYQMDKDQRGCFGAVFWNPTDSVYQVTRVEFNASSAVNEVFNDRGQGIGVSHPTLGWERDAVRRVVYWAGLMDVQPRSTQEFYVDIDGNGKDEAFAVAVRITANGTVYSNNYSTKQVNGDVPWSVLWLGQGPTPIFSISTLPSAETTFYVSLEEDCNRMAIDAGGNLTILVPPEFTNVVDVGGTGWGSANITGNRIEVRNTQSIQDDYVTYAFNARAPSHPGLYMLNVSFSGTPEEHPVGNFSVHVTGIPNSELDLEIQWTNVDFSLANEDLCIYGGAMGSENIIVDVWSGSSWINLFPDLHPGWNNISVSPYLTSSTLAARFKGAEEVGDTTQDRWNIDVSLLHVWSDEYIAEVELTGSSNTEELSQLNWTVNSAWTTSSVNVTLQLYDYSLDGYSTTGEGYLAYGSSVTSHTDETRSQTITVNSTSFRDRSGNWKMKIRGSKTTAVMFNFRTDLVKFETTVCHGPVASFSVSPSHPAPNTTVVFNASDSLDPDGFIATYSWNFGDGNTTSISSSHIGHSYLTYGDFNVTLTVIDNDGYNDSVSQIVRVQSPSPFDGRPIIPYILPAGIALIVLLVGLVWKRGEKSSPPLEFDFFNTMTGGGIPVGSSVLIVGDTASGKSLLCQQLAYKYLNEGKACLFASYDDFPTKIRESMKSFGWNLAPLEQVNNFAFIDCYSSRARKTSHERYSIKQPFALTELSIVSSTALEETEDVPTAFFLDSATALFTNLDPSRVMSFLQDRGAKMKGKNGIFIFTLGKGVIKTDIANRLEEVTDGIIELNIYEEGEQLQRRMRIKKLRGQRHLTEWQRYTIKADAGIVFLRSKDS